MPRAKKNSAKTNIVISVVFHVVIVAALFFFAAREGVLGTKLKEIAVVIVPKEKPPEPPKEIPPPRIEPPKEQPIQTPQEPPKVVATAPPPKQAAPPPQAPTGGGDAAPGPAAPAAVIPADFSFGDGAKIVETTGNAPFAYYKNFVEYTLRSNWDRPTDIADDNYTADVEVRVDGSGAILSYAMIKGSGDQRWDDSVKKAMAATKTVGRVPPKGFPQRFTIHFDVLAATEELVQ